MIADILNYAHFDSISCSEKFEIKELLIAFLCASSAHKFSLAQMASEEQTPLAKCTCLWLVGYRYSWVLTLKLKLIINTDCKG